MEKGMRVSALESAMPRLRHLDIACYEEKSDWRNPNRCCLSLKLDLMAAEDEAQVTVGDSTAHGIRLFSPTLLMPLVELCMSKK